MADSPPVERFFTVEIPEFDLEVDSAREHAFQEQQERDVRAIRLGLGKLESTRDTPDKPDVSDLQNRIDLVEEEIDTQQDQITDLSARVSDLHLRREGTAVTSPKKDAGSAESPLQQIHSALQSMAAHELHEVLAMVVEELGKKLGLRSDGPIPEQSVSPSPGAATHTKLSGAPGHTEGTSALTAQVVAADAIQD
jgi:hypothetical protein